MVKLMEEANQSLSDLEEEILKSFAKTSNKLQLDYSNTKCLPKKVLYEEYTMKFCLIELSIGKKKFFEITNIF